MNWEMGVGISSVVIAVCALATSIWQASLARKHSIISHRPHLTSWTHNSTSKGLYEVELLNNGLGPALIKNFVVRVDGKVMTGEMTEPLSKALELLFPEHPNIANFSFMGKNYAMPAKDCCSVVSIQFTEDNLPSPQYVENQLNRADIEIEYESFYEEKFFFSTADYNLKK